MPSGLAERLDDCEAVISTAQEELIDDHFSAGFGKFREALNLSRGFPVLEDRVSAFAVEQAKKWLPQNWRLARSLLLEVREANAKLTPPQDIWESIQQQERESSIATALKAADQASSNGLTSIAVRRLIHIGLQYPNDRRIQNHLQALEVRRRDQSAYQNLREQKQQTDLAEDQKALTRAIWARAREYEKAGFHTEALEQWRALEELDPHYPGLDQALGRESGETIPALTIPSFAKTRTSLHQGYKWKTSATVTLAAAALAGLGLVVWPHVRPHSANTVARVAPATAIRPLTRPVVEASSDDPSPDASTRSLVVPAASHASPASQADDRAWAAVNPQNIDSVENYLSHFPGGIHRPVAIEAMIDYRRRRVNQQQSEDVLRTVRQYASAWTDRDPQAIASLETYLAAPKIQAQLLPVKSLVMNITPTAEPSIRGEKASVLCRQQTFELLNDGVSKQTPERLLTFDLAKRSGAWVISGIRP